MKADSTAEPRENLSTALWRFRIFPQWAYPTSSHLTLTMLVFRMLFHYQALMMIALTFSGLVMLYRVCQPFNVTRAVTFIAAVTCCILFVTVPVLGERVFEVTYKGATVHLGDIQFTLDQMLLIIILVQASFPVSGFLIRFFDMINPADD